MNAVNSSAASNRVNLVIKVKIYTMPFMLFYIKKTKLFICKEGLDLLIMMYSVHY
jgi:hypothetical protein